VAFQGWIHDFTRPGVQSIRKGHWRSSAKGAEGEFGSGEGAVPSPEEFCIFYIEMVSFYAFLVIFIDAATFKKGHPNQKGGCPDTLDTPWIRPCV